MFSRTVGMAMYSVQAFKNRKTTPGMDGYVGSSCEFWSRFICKRLSQEGV